MKPHRTLSETEAQPESFHDCHVHTFEWRGSFEFSIGLQYIVEWIQPTSDVPNFRFMISEARLKFANTADLAIAMDWCGASLDAQIESVQVVSSRPTPNGRTARKFEITFAEPEGTISLWSTGYDVELLTEPIQSNTTSAACR